MNKCPDIAIIGENARNRRQEAEELIRSFGFDAAGLIVLAPEAPADHSLDGAIILREGDGRDKALISKWVGHPHLRVMHKDSPRLTKELSVLLSSREIERKFLIRYPDIQGLMADPFCGRADICQVYAKDAAGGNIRLRERRTAADTAYILTKKRAITETERIETEERLTKEEFDALMAAARGCPYIKKTRYCRVYNDQYFEIDVFPFWDDAALMELELADIHQAIDFPPDIEIIREVTEEPEYRNSYLARRHM